MGDSQLKIGLLLSHNLYELYEYNKNLQKTSVIQNKSIYFLFRGAAYIAFNRNIIHFSYSAKLCDNNFQK